MTIELHPGTRILALDLHPQRYGYAVLETPPELLDWGVRRRYRKREPRKVPSMYRALRLLLDIWQPSLVVIKEPPRRQTVRIRKRYARLVMEIRRGHIPVQRVSDQVVRSAFGDENQSTKYAITSALAQRFPFLAPVAPSPRKIWRSEDYHMDMFMAVALALSAKRTDSGKELGEPHR